MVARLAFLRAQGFAPHEAARRMTVAEGLQVELFASEPLVRQPVAIEFDDRGRLWVIQYLQYPNPAELKRVKVDQYSRTVYDRVPEPPPKGPKGTDRITILEDRDGDGRIDSAKDFVTGLNLASGLAFGHGGVFVLQTPYLLFYPDRNGDDIPDGDPEVLLSGFGMEDAHSVANSLTWGPDGWLYGCQGSTVTAQIRGIEFQQGVWRYHPLTRRFELFCEGGGNSWGLDFDRQGNLFYSTNHGGYCMLHGVQGGYYWKSFGKHGALHNPFTYGYFDHVPHRNFRGGHVTVGGIIYQGDTFPERYRGKYIAADLLGHGVYWHNVEPRGTTFQSSHGGEIVVANDTWFAPSDVTMGPDGAIYVADWHDARTAHPDPDAEWDRSNGRVFRIAATGAKSAAIPDLTKLSSMKLIALLDHPNDWLVRKARRLLADRRDSEVIFPLRTLIFESRNDHLVLQALWALHVSGGFDDQFALRLLDHRNPDVRSWTIRFLGDEGKAPPAIGNRLQELAETEPSAIVRSQLACTAKRLPAEIGLTMIQRILRRNEDLHDPYIPLLAWWAVEHHAMAAVDQVLERFATPTAWQSAIMRDVILSRLIRRFAADGSESGNRACVRMLKAVPAAERRRQLLGALEQGWRDRSTETRTPWPAEFESLLTAWWTNESSDPTLLRLLVRLHRPEALDQALRLITDRQVAVDDRVRLLEILGEFGNPEMAPAILKLLMEQDKEAIQLAALSALQRFVDDSITVELLRVYPRLNGRAQARACDVLLSRKRSARAFLEAIEQGKIEAKNVAVEHLRSIPSHREPQLDALVRKHWGSLHASTPGEKLAEIRRLNNDLRAGRGELSSGQALFQKHCASCHRLFDEGQIVGPDLTHANRKDRDYLLLSVVDPSAVIRKEFLSQVIQTKDGRVLTGLLAENMPGHVTLLDAKNERTAVRREQIESMQDSPVSLMPENLLKDLKPQEIRDLFSYLQSEKGVKK